MKKVFVSAAVAAIFTLLSCNKQEMMEAGVNTPVFSGRIVSTMTSIDVSDGKVEWEMTDEITVFDSNSNQAVYGVQSIDPSTGRAIFVFKSGDVLGEGPYSASYGTAPTASQNFSASAGRLYMIAPQTSGLSFSFTVQCGLMRLVLTKSGESVKRVAVTGTPTNGEESTFTLNCAIPQDISSAKDFYIAVPDGKYDKIEIVNSFDEVCTLNASSALDVVNNHIKPVTLVASKIDFVPDNALPGKFTVAPGKKIHFSKGNLRYTIASSTWSFYDEQYECGPVDYGDGHDKEISLFTWGYGSWSTSPSTISCLSGKSSFSSTDDWGSVIDSRALWRTLSKDEWIYMIQQRNNADDKVGFASVCGIHGVVLISDSFKDPATNSTVGSNGLFVPRSGGALWTKNEYKSVSDWEEMESAGAVFLPAAGYRTKQFVANTDQWIGYYYSSSADSDKAYSVYFANGNIEPNYKEAADFGCSVRLVTDID